MVDTLRQKLKKYIDGLSNRLNEAEKAIGDAHSRGDESNKYYQMGRKSAYDDDILELARAGIRLRKDSHKASS